MPWRKNLLRLQISRAWITSSGCELRDLLREPCHELLLCPLTTLWKWLHLPPWVSFGRTTWNTRYMHIFHNLTLHILFCFLNSTGITPLNLNLLFSKFLQIYKRPTRSFFSESPFLLPAGVRLCAIILLQLEFHSLSMLRPLSHEISNLLPVWLAGIWDSLDRRWLPPFEKYSLFECRSKHNKKWQCRPSVFLLPAEVIVSPRLLLRLTVLMPNLDQGGGFCWLDPALFTLMLSAILNSAKVFFSAHVFGFGSQKQSAELCRGQSKYKG